MTGGTDCTDGRIRGGCISAHQGSGVALARPATPGRAGSGPREVATSYHATHRWAPQCGSSSSGRHFPRFYIQPREAKGWVLSTYSSSVRVRERSAGAVAQRRVGCVEMNYNQGYCGVNNQSYRQSGKFVTEGNAVPVRALRARCHGGILRDRSNYGVNNGEED